MKNKVQKFTNEFKNKMKLSSILFSVISVFGFVLLLGFSSCGNSDKSGSDESSLPKDSAVAKKTKPDTLLVIKGTQVNMRVAPDLKAVRIKQLKTNDTCVILEKGKQETVDEMTDFWYKIRFKNKEGWVYGAFTSLKVPEKPAVEKKKTWIK
jgi:uncharacterized protein YgiM (DUF1202 family)